MLKNIFGMTCAAMSVITTAKDISKTHIPVWTKIGIKCASIYGEVYITKKVNEYVKKKLDDINCD